MAGLDLSRCAVIVLAAGQARRMGGANKLLLTVDGRALLSHTLATISKVGVGDVVVVTGRDRDAVEALVAGTSARTVHNPAFEKGMGTSLAAGVGALRDDVAAVFVHLGDVAFVCADTFRAVGEAFSAQASEGVRIVIPVYEGRRGHPVLFAADLLPQLAVLAGDTGAKTVCAANQHNVAVLDVNDAMVSIDVDTQEDFLALKAQFEGAGR